MAEPKFAAEAIFTFVLMCNLSFTFAEIVMAMFLGKFGNNMMERMYGLKQYCEQQGTKQ